MRSRYQVSQLSLIHVQWLHLPTHRHAILSLFREWCHAISRFDMSSAQAHWVRSKPIFRVMQLKLHEPTMAIGYSLRMCARHANSTNPGRSILVFRSTPIAEAEMSNRLIKLNRNA